MFYVLRLIASWSYRTCRPGQSGPAQYLGVKKMAEKQKARLNTLFYASVKIQNILCDISKLVHKKYQGKATKTIGRCIEELSKYNDLIKEIADSIEDDQQGVGVQRILSKQEIEWITFDLQSGVYYFIQQLIAEIPAIECLSRIIWYTNEIILDYAGDKEKIRSKIKYLKAKAQSGKKIKNHFKNFPQRPSRKKPDKEADMVQDGSLASPKKADYKNKTSNEYKAMILLKENPNWSVAKIAKTLGVSRTTPYGWKNFKKARTAIAKDAEDARRDMPRAFINPKTGNIEPF